LLATYPVSFGMLGGWLVASKLAAKLHAPVAYAKARAGLSTLRIADLAIGPAAHPMVSMTGAEISFAAAWGAGTIVLEAPKIDLRRGGPDDNVSALLARMRPTSGRGAGERQASSSYPALVIHQGSLRLQDAQSDLAASIGKFDADWQPGRRFSIAGLDISARLGSHGSEGAPAFAAEQVIIEGPLFGMRPQGFPQITVKEGMVQPLPNLPLTGIAGSLAPTQAGGDAFDVMLAGSYAGAKRVLWTASGNLKLAKDWASVDGLVGLRAQRFSLDKIADVLPSSVLEPENTEVDAAIEARFNGRRVALTGNLEVAGLSLAHESLASDPIENTSFAVSFEANIDRDQRKLELTSLEGKIGSLIVRVAGSVALPSGTYRFKDGRSLKVLPKIELTLQVPRTPCAKILASIPPPLVPKLQGFVLQGMFEADLHTKIDFSNLDALDIGGKVGIDGCQVLRAPPEVIALGESESIMQTVEVPPTPSGKDDELMTFAVGPDNPDFVPYDKISRHLIAAVMTTEDSGFFKHRGWVSAQFKNALRRNLAGGGFRLGASSITMQMVKNVLLSREKTLSRKFQELFLVWYVEQILSKERILELYFNAIEFGPRLYGIGAATRHYFGKTPAELTPLEAAFFSSILPSPKKRYVQYCHGTLTPQWERYLRRILSKMHERGRLDDEEFTTAMASSLVFDKAEMTMTEKQCVDWVHRITLRPEPEPEPEADGQ
jgi:hypothetical protein